MSRSIRLTDGWSFARGTAEDASEAFRPVSVPHDWAIEGSVPVNQENGTSQGFRTERGIGWYRRSLTLEKQPGMRYFLDFDGVMEESTLWVNGTAVGGHGWGYSPFRLEITDAIHGGVNELLLRCDCSARPADRWYSGCGLYRPVSLLTVPAEWLDDRRIVVRTVFAGEQARVTVSTGTEKPVQAALLLDGQTVARAEGTAQLTLNVADPQRWSAVTPTLYTLTLRFRDGSDEVSLRIGLREAVFTTEGLRVNGEPVYLRGVCVHQDVACVGIAATGDLWRQRL